MNQYKKLITPLIFCFSSLHAWDALADFPGPERLNPSIINFNEKIYGHSILFLMYGYMILN